MKNSIIQTILRHIDNVSEILDAQQESERIDFVIKLIEELYPPFNIFEAASSTSKMIKTMDRIEVNPLLNALFLAKQNEQRYFTNDKELNMVLATIFDKIDYCSHSCKTSK